MHLVAAAVCPHPPLIIPTAAGGAAAELDGLRAACVTAVGRLFSAGADAIMIIGTDAKDETFAAPISAEFADFGPIVGGCVGNGGYAKSTKPTTPLSVGIGVWLLEHYKTVAGISNADWHDTGFSAAALASDRPSADCFNWGLDLGRRSGTTPEDVAVGLLVMGDGSAKRTDKAPGAFDPRAQPYDRRVARALGAANGETLRRLDHKLSAELMVAGRPAWQAMAGLVAATGRGWTGDLLYDAAPYGVGYFVASWLPG
jgi:hypothetical protein